MMDHVCLRVSHLCVTIKCVFVVADNRNFVLSGSVIKFVACIRLSAGNFASQDKSYFLQFMQVRKQKIITMVKSAPQKRILSGQVRAFVGILSITGKIPSKNMVGDADLEVHGFYRLACQTDLSCTANTKHF